jgi:hypothetical protein
MVNYLRRLGGMQLKIQPNDKATYKHNEGKPISHLPLPYLIERLDANSRLPFIEDNDGNV